VEKKSASAKRRPALDMAIKDLRPGDTRLDRLARNMRDLYIRLEHIEQAGAKFKSLQETFDFDTTTGKFVLGILGLVAQLESQLTKDRTTAGMQARKDRGFTLGRTPTMDAKKQTKAFALLRSGKSVAFVADKLKVSKATMYGYFKITRKRGKVLITKRKK
jgi:DNA invertase Pin-like site-specific DNA recombinase